MKKATLANSLAVQLPFSQVQKQTHVAWLFVKKLFLKDANIIL
jgi:hypothetical protein